MASTVIIADADALVRDILRLACARHEDEVEVVAETGDAAELVSLSVELEPSVVVAAPALGDTPLDEVLPAVIASGARVIVVSGDPSAERLTRLLGDGAAGYLQHDAHPDEVADGVLAVARGASVLNPTSAALLLNQWRRLRAGSDDNGRRMSALTRREQDVLEALAEGMPTKAIARRLGMAPKTVENHKIHIFDKLGVRTQAHAVSVAIGSGLVAVPPLPSDDEPTN